MSTELKSHAKDVHLTRFWGGQRGVCVQVTMKRHPSMGPDTSSGFFTSVQLTRAQAAALSADLLDFAQNREEDEFGHIGVDN